MMASGSSKKRSGSTPSKPVIRHSQGLPWLTILATGLVVVLAGAIAWVVIAKNNQNSAAQAAVEPFIPTAENRDPSKTIPGIYIGAATDSGVDKPFSYPAYKAALHVKADQRVAYDRFPPVGGPHDEQWADCQGVVYTTAVRDENMVHTLEHGAIWIAYNPDSVKGGDLDTLKALVNGHNFISMSPYPGLKKPISLQAWSHQLQIDSATDPRIAQFITALRQNAYVYPETGARCDSPGWDSSNPPAFDASPRTAKDIQMSGAGANAAANESGKGAVDSGALGSGSEGSGAESTGSSAAPSGAESSGSTAGSPEGPSAAASSATDQSAAGSAASSAP